MKAFYFTAILLISALALSACGGGTPAGNGESDGSPGNGGSGNGQQVEIRFSWWGDTKRNEIYNEIVDRFEDEYPHITVRREFGGWNDYWDRLATQIAGGNAPDVVSMHQFYVSDYARRNALLDLETTTQLNLDDFPEPTIDSGRIDGKLVMIPKGVTMPGWVYNTALFDELGVDYPQMNWTYDDFMAKVKELREKGMEKGIWGSPDMGSGQLQPDFRYFLRQNGQDLFTEEGKLGFERDTLVAWWSMWDELRQADAIPDATTNTEYENMPLEQSMFVTGRTAMHRIPANQIYLYQQQFESGEIQIVGLPVLDGGEDGEYIEGAYLSVTERSRHPEEAALFIDFFVNSERSLELFKVEQGSPASTKMSEFVMPLLEPAQQRAVTFIQETLPKAHPAVYAPLGVQEVEAAYKDNATRIAFGQLSVEEAADAFIAAAEAVLK